MQRSTRRAMLFAGLALLILTSMGISLFDSATRERPFRDRSFGWSDRNPPNSGPTPPRQGTENPESLVSLARDVPPGRGDRAVLESIQESFLAENPDVEWAPTQERRLALLIRNSESPEGSLLSVECRQTICKASIFYSRQPELSGQRAFTEQLEQNLNMEILGEIGIAREGDGASITVFLSRSRR